MEILLLLSHFSCVRLCDPIDSSHQAPPSLGFSRQEHWSGFPFPSPMYESETWKWSWLVVSDPQRPHGLQPSRLLRPWDFPGKSTGMGAIILMLILSIRIIIFLSFLQTISRGLKNYEWCVSTCFPTGNKQAGIDKKLSSTETQCTLSSQ